MIKKVPEDRVNNDFLDFGNALNAVTEGVDKVLSSSPIAIRSYTNHLTKSHGKYIRAISLLTASINSDQKIHQDAVKFAISVEILHLATLVHDDVIDNADTRRGVATLQKKHGRKIAVLCGDYLFCQSIKIASTVENRDRYESIEITDYFSKVCIGEIGQFSNNNNYNLSALQYFRIISGKTAALFEASFFAGGVVSGDETQELKKYKRIGRYIGLIFQLTDDCIDFEETEFVAKKPIQSDFEQGVITLPLIFAFESNDELRKKAHANNLDRNEINRVVKITDSIGMVKSVSKKYYNKCIKVIESMTCSESKKAQITAILDKSYNGLKK